MADDAHSSPESIPLKDQLDLDKIAADIATAKAQRGKIEVETKLLASQWRALGKVLIGLTPAFVAVAGLFLLHNSRWFEVQNEKLEITRKYLNETNALLVKESEKLARGNAELATRKGVYEERIRYLETDQKRLTSVIAELNRSLASLAESNKLVQPLVAELTRVKAQRDGLAQTNLMLNAQFKTLLSAARSGAVRFTADSTVRIDELGRIRISEGGAVFTDEHGNVLTDEHGNPLTQGSTTTILPDTNSPPK